MEIVKEQLMNEYGTSYGWIVDVKLDEKEDYWQAFDRMMKEFGLDPNSDRDREFVYNYGSGAWNQFRWTIS